MKKVFVAWLATAVLIGGAPIALADDDYVMAGDIAAASTSAPDRWTAELIDGDGTKDYTCTPTCGTDHDPRKVFTLGDNAYNTGSPSDFTTYYAPDWGQSSIFDKTLPAPGNHDWDQGDYDVAGDLQWLKDGYCTYFFPGYTDDCNGGYEAGSDPWYAERLGGSSAPLFVVSLDSQAAEQSTVAEDLEDTFLLTEMTSTTEANTDCDIAYFHHPVFSAHSEHDGTFRQSGTQYNEGWYTTFDNKGGDLVIVGHNHFYQRFAQQDVTYPDPVTGPTRPREIIVGTGGQNIYDAIESDNDPNSQQLLDDEELGSGISPQRRGVLRIVIHPVTNGWDTYDLEYWTIKTDGTGVRLDDSLYGVECRDNDPKT
jgi:hypothetical protein